VNAEGASDHAGTLKLYFIRHGETEWSLSGQHTGRTDIALTAHGDDQARALGRRLRETRFSRVLTSPSRRARRTCELVGLHTAAEIKPGLAEWDYGEYEARTSVDIAQTWPGWNVFRDGGPGGETPEQIGHRADRLIAELSGQAGNIALFSHGQFGSVLAVRWIGLAVIEGEHFSLAPASLSILGHNPGHADVRSIELWNDAR
jgi:broad specificity phosphatase PhoE